MDSERTCTSEGIFVSNHSSASCCFFIYKPAVKDYTEHIADRGEHADLGEGNRA